MEKILTFRQPRLTRPDYQIADNGKQVGSLTYEGLLNYKAVASLGKFCWQLSRKGVLGGKVMIMLDSTTKKIDSQGLYFEHGAILLDAKKFSFKRGGLGLTSHLAWYDETGVPCITYSISGLFKKSGEINVMSDKLPELLIPLGLFIGLNKDTDDTAAASSIVAVS